MGLVQSITQNVSQYLKNSNLSHAIKNDCDVKEVLEKGADPNHLLHDTPLNKCAEKNDMNNVLILLKFGANPNDQGFLHGKKYTPIIHAAKNNNMKMLKILVKYKANVNLSNSYGFTPLIYAVKNNNKNMILYLLSKNANINLTCKSSCNYEEPNYDTALSLAVRLDNDDIFDLLLRNGADINKKSQNGIFPLLRASQKSVEHVRKIMRYKPDVNSVNKKKETALFTAVDSKTLDFLLECKADINHKNLNGETVLFSAVRKNNFENFNFLVERKADINIADNSGNTVLFEAVKNSRYNFVKFLVENNADLLYRNNLGLTAEEYSGSFGNWFIYNYLVQNNPNTHVRVIERDNNEHQCCICTETITLNQNAIKLSCRHVFHAPCLGEWIFQKKSCPMCRRSIII